MKEIILTYELQQENALALNRACRETGMEKIRVAPKDYGKALGFVAGLDGFLDTPGTGAKPGLLGGEMLVFCGLERERLDVFLAAYRQAGGKSVALKAVLTPHNVWWDSARLYGELSSEHEQMLRYVKDGAQDRQKTETRD